MQWSDCHLVMSNWDQSLGTYILKQHGPRFVSDDQIMIEIDPKNAKGNPNPKLRQLFSIPMVFPWFSCGFAIDFHHSPRLPDALRAHRTMTKTPSSRIAPLPTCSHLHDGLSATWEKHDSEEKHWEVMNQSINILPDIHNPRINKYQYIIIY